MKRYLITSVALLCMGLEASDNPFDLKTNLQSLDDDQSSLISELRKTSSDDDQLMDELEALETKKADTPKTEMPPKKTPPAKEIKEQKPTVQTQVQEPKKEQVQETKIETVSETTPKKQAVKEEPSKEGVTLETIMADAQMQAEKERLKALEEERIAVQKYEEERLRKKREREEAAKLKAEQEAQEAEKKQKEAAVAQNDTKPAPVEKKTQAAEKKPERKSILDDIDLDEEERQAKEEADRLYLEAIKEVDAE